MLIKQLPWRKQAQYSPPETPPLAHQDLSDSLSLHPAPSFIPLCPPFSPLRSICYPRCSVSITFYLFTSGPGSHWSSPLLSSHPQRSVPDLRGAAFPPYNFLLNSDVLFIYLRGALLSQHPSSLFVLPLPERLTIPLASRLIYHPNGGYRRVEKKTAICRGRQSHRGTREGGEGCLDCNCCSSSACQRVCLHDQTSL